MAARRGRATKPAATTARTPAADAAVTASLLPPATYAPALNAGLQALASRVQEMHQAISGTTFDNLLRVPGFALPTRIVQGVHDAVAQGVYAAVRHGGGAALSIAADAERLATDPLRRLGRKEQLLRSAVNGVVGDALAESGSALAVQMGLHAGGAPLQITHAALAPLRPRVCVFVHGLACDEQSWSLRTEAWQGSAWADALGAGRRADYGALLEHELGVSAIALRYNTGLAIDANAGRLAALLERAAQAAPHVQEWLMIGHSMGGLVARRAHELAQAEGLVWAQRAPMIVCLGSPHQGAPLEKIGHVATAALNLSGVTKPLARIADARSQGIKDLRHGLNKKPHAKAPAPPALRLLFATLGNDVDDAGGMSGSWVGKLLGDGLVRAGSAADEGAIGDVQRVELAGLGHMALLNHPRVYAVLRRWLGAPESV
jgi:pimeloyl-ACP methyl ester carboxylesterase